MPYQLFLQLFSETHEQSGSEDKGHEQNSSLGGKGAPTLTPEKSKIRWEGNTTDFRLVGKPRAYTWGRGFRWPAESTSGQACAPEAVVCRGPPGLLGRLSRRVAMFLSVVARKWGWKRRGEPRALVWQGPCESAGAGAALTPAAAGTTAPGMPRGRRSVDSGLCARSVGAAVRSGPPGLGRGSAAVS